jgi:LmbE family N-acetylglucosaminyl deacetylase
VSDPDLVPDGDLGRVRTGELHAAARVLGLSDVLVFEHPDGDLRWADVPEFHTEIVSAIREYRADAVITFAEDGLYWHVDHVGVHERTCTAVASLGSEAPSLYYVTMPRGVMRAVAEAATARGGTSTNTGFWGIGPDAFGSGTRRPSFVVNVGDWVPRKLAALLCHRTQMGPNNPFTWIDDADARRLLAIEQFRRARPHRGESLLEPLAEPVVRPSARKRA